MIEGILRRRTMNIGIFGGSFNPPHTGHLILANSAAEAFGLDVVYFVPTYVSPFKMTTDFLSAELRSEMVALAISDNKRFAMDPFEAQRTEPSYSIETVRHFSAQFPEAMLHLLMGADAFNEFYLWREPAEILERAKVCVACRPQYEVEQDPNHFRDHAHTFRMPYIDIASSVLRQRIRDGKSVQYLVPWTVKTFIEANGLYKG
jgi:nicotinate-nucleotide adenylyltransferase